jgi:tripartite-type tricarboxylate transporter receptor subunit TctC
MTSPFEYPVAQVTLITGAPGGGIDFATRLIAEALAVRIGLPVSVKNVPAGSMAEVVAAAPADGSTLLMTGKILWLTPFLRQNVSYDPIRDFAPIALTVRSPNILIVTERLPVKSVDDLIALARSKPGEIKFTSSGAGSSTHLAGELFKSLADIDIVHAGRVGNVAAVNAVAGGEIEFMFSGVTAAQRVIKAGSVRALAIGSAERSALFPGLPTVAEVSLPEYESESILALFAPATTPGPVVDYLNREVNDVLCDPSVEARLLEADLEAAGSSPEALRAVMRSEMQRLGAIITKK